MNRASFLAKSAIAGMLSFCPGPVLRWVQRPLFKAADVSSQQPAFKICCHEPCFSFSFFFFLQECRYLSCRYQTHLWKNQAQTVLSHLHEFIYLSGSSHSWHWAGRLPGAGPAPRSSQSQQIHHWISTRKGWKHSLLY